MNLAEIRRESRQTATALGYPDPRVLPLLDHSLPLRSQDAVCARMLALHPVVAVACGFSPGRAKDWLIREDLTGWLSRTEVDYLDSAAGPSDEISNQVEALWAFAWTLSIIPELDFSKPCPESFVHMLPDLKKGEDSNKIRERLSLRSADELIRNLDLSYCIHWGIRESARHFWRRRPGKVDSYVVEERRRALEWIFSSDDWDEITLDT